MLDDAADLTKRVEASGGSKKDSNAMSRSDLTLHMDILAKALQDVSLVGVNLLACPLPFTLADHVTLRLTFSAHRMGSR